MGTKKGKPIATAEINGVIVSRVPVPRGTVLSEARVHTHQGVCVFFFQVLWWALPFYLLRAAWGTVKQGMKVQVHSPIKSDLGIVCTPTHLRESTIDHTKVVH